MVDVGTFSEFIQSMITASQFIMSFVPLVLNLMMEHWPLLFFIGVAFTAGTIMYAANLLEFSIKVVKDVIEEMVDPEGYKKAQKEKQEIQAEFESADNINNDFGYDWEKDFR